MRYFTLCRLMLLFLAFHFLSDGYVLAQTLENSTKVVIREGTPGKAKIYSSKNKDEFVVSVKSNMEEDGITSETVAHFIKEQVRDIDKVGGIALGDVAIFHSSAIADNAVLVIVFSGTKAISGDGKNDQVTLEEYLDYLPRYARTHQERVKARKQQQNE